jgi:hypothetical protein
MMTAPTASGPAITPSISRRTALSSAQFRVFRSEAPASLRKSQTQRLAPSWTFSSPTFQSPPEELARQAVLAHLCLTRMLSPSLTSTALFLVFQRAILWLKRSVFMEAAALAQKVALVSSVTDLLKKKIGRLLGLMTCSPGLFQIQMPLSKTETRLQG